MKSTLYSILQIGEKASQEEIATAYQLRKSRLIDAGDQDAKNELMFMQHALEVLSDQGLRAKYDLHLKDAVASENIVIEEPVTAAGRGVSGTTKVLLVLLIALLAYLAYPRLYPASQSSHPIKGESPASQLENSPPPAAAPATAPAAQQPEAQAPGPVPAIESAPPPAVTPATEAPAQAAAPPTTIPVAPLPPPAVPAKIVDINDANIVPLPNPTTQRRAYLEFLSKRSPRAFVICKNNSVMTFNGDSDFVNKKLAEVSNRCTPYAIDDAVVWTGATN